MCTIGVVFEGQTIHTFKQCDLIPVTHFNKPEQRTGTGNVKSYLAMTRGEDHGRMWAGTNSEGVSFVAADAYTVSENYYVTDEQTDALFEAYENTISRYSSAREAADYLSAFYQDMGDGTAFPTPDISMLTGWEDAAKTQPLAIFIEYMPGPNNHDPVRTVVRTGGHFCSTNNFRIQPQSISYAANHSTYLRLERAETILQQEPTYNGIIKVLTDQYYGECELSVCRVTPYIGQEFFTQATALFSATPNQMPQCEYQINGNPLNNPLQPYVSAPE